MLLLLLLWSCCCVVLFCCCCLSVAFLLCCFCCCRFDLVEPAPGVSEGGPVDAEAVNQALQKLSLEQYEVVVLKVFNDLTFREISEVLGLTQKTCESRYVYGLRHLSEFLHKSDWEER